MSDGLKFLTVGGSEELIVGNDYAATIGMTNYAYIGSETTINVGLENSIKLGGEFAYAYGSKFEWTNVGGFSLEEGEVFELGDTVSKQAGTSLTFSAGYGPTALVEAETLAALKTGLKTAVTTMTALNAALGVATSAVLLGMSEGEESQEGWEPAVVSASAAAINAAVTMAFYVTLKKSMQALLHTYEHLAKVSTVVMDADGIRQKVDLPMALSQVNMSSLGVSITTEDMAALEASLVLNPGSAILNADTTATVKAESVKVGQLEADVLTSGLSAISEEVVLKNGESSTVTLTEATAEVRSPSVHVTVDGTQGVLVEQASVLVSAGTTEVSVTDASFTVSQDGAVLEMAEGTVSLDGELLMFG